MSSMNTLLDEAKIQAKRSYHLVCAARIARNVEMQTRTLMGNHRSSKTGTQNAARDVEQAVSYIDTVFDDYIRYGGVEAFAGRIAEVGPGDNAGVAMRFLESGAESVDLLDRFWCARDIDKNLAIYRALRDRSPKLRELLDHEIPAQADDEPEVPGIVWHCGPEAAVENFFESHGAYDCIVSRAVLEHVHDPIAALQKMTHALRPGGLLLHKVDLRDHGMFSHSFHELKFLEVSAPVYTAMSWRSGRPNRVLVDEYRDALARLSELEAEILVTRVVGVGDVDPHVPFSRLSQQVREQALAAVRMHKGKFARRFRDKQDEDLAVAGIFIVARKSH